MKTRKARLSRPLLLLSLTALLGIGVGSSLVKASAEREFNESFDLYLEDFSSDTLSGTLTGGEFVSSPYLSALPDAEYGHTADSAVYKIGYGGGMFAVNKTITISMRKASEVALPLSDLVFGLRGGDTYLVYPVTFDNIFDSDMNPMPALTTSWQNYVIDLNNSVEASAYYLNASDGLPSDKKVVDVASEIFGIHVWYGVAGVAPTAIEISSIMSGTAVVDNFDRIDVNEKANPGVEANWWNGSIGQIVTRHVNLSAGAVYSVYQGVHDTWENIALTLSGDGSTTAMAPVGNDGTIGTYVDYANLRDNENLALPALNATHQNVVVNAVNSGFTGDFAGIAVQSTSAVSIWTVFFTNMESRQPEWRYPNLDLENAVIFDTFDRADRASFATTYEASVAALTDEEKNFGVEFNIAWSGSDKVSLADGAIHLADPADSVLVNYNEGVLRDPVGKQYLVVAIKTVPTNVGETVSLENLRFQMGDGAVWVKDMESAFGLPVAQIGQVGYPYVDGDFTWLIADLSIAGVTANKVLTIYLGGNTGGEIIIDQIFFADALDDNGRSMNTPVEVQNIDSAVTFTGGYQYVWGGTVPAMHQFLHLEVTSDGVADLSSVRIGVGGSPVLFFADEVLLDPNGAPIAVTLEANVMKTLVIDLVASGIGLAGGDFHIHTDGGTATGTLTFGKSYYSDYVKYDMPVAWESKSVTTLAASYGYIGYFSLAGNVNQFLLIEIEAAAADATGLESVRIQFLGGEKWFKDGVLKDPLGNSIGLELAEGNNKIMIDLVASGLPVGANAGDTHIHGGGFGVGDHTFVISAISTFDFYSPYLTSEVLPVLDVVPPTVALNITGGTAIGEEATIVITMSDNITAVGDLTVEITVTIGSGEELETVTVTDNKFTPTKAGTYTITVLVTDGAGLVTTQVAQHDVPEDNTAPTVSLSVTGGAKVGEEATIVVTASDDFTAAGDLDIVITVKFGIQDVVVTDNKFTPTEAGTYTITAMVTDEGDLATTETFELVVAAADVVDQPDNNLPVILGVTGGALLLIAGGLLAYFLILKPKKLVK